VHNFGDMSDVVLLGNVVYVSIVVCVSNRLRR
jgi:hypothetical protein